MEQSSWIRFLKYLHDYENDKKTSAQLAGRAYTPNIKKEYRWDIWAASQKVGKLDHYAATCKNPSKRESSHFIQRYIGFAKCNFFLPDASPNKETIVNLPSDNDLIIRLRNGDISAGGILYERYKRNVYYFVLKLLKDDAAAQNVVQQTFTAMIEKIGSFRQDATIRALDQRTMMANHSFNQ